MLTVCFHSSAMDSNLDRTSCRKDLRAIKVVHVVARQKIVAHKREGRSLVTLLGDAKRDTAIRIH